MTEWRRYNRLGFSEPGTWQDQPSLWVAEMDAVYAGEHRYEREQELERARQDDLQRQALLKLASALGS